MGYSPPSSSYSPLMLSHQTGLSITASTANTFYAIGNAISVPRSGIVVISMSGHVNGGTGYINLSLTRGSSIYDYGGSPTSLFGNSYSIYDNFNITATSSVSLSSFPFYLYYGSSDFYTLSALYHFVLPVYSGDSLQFYATNGTASDITYIDDVLVMLQ
ncbi:MAG: hypothetical protein QXV17_13140 [Candidatus Micrarchaeaceae archaeon]